MDLPQASIVCLVAEFRSSYQHFCYLQVVGGCYLNIFAIAFHKSDVEAKCFDYAGIIRKRADDNEETIKKRLVVYHSQTQPLIEWYKKEGLHHHINGSGTLERIFADIKNVIDNL